MQSRQQKTIEKYRSQIKDLRRRIKSVLSKDNNLASPINPEAEKEKLKLNKKEEGYTLYRLKNALGKDPEYLDDEIFFQIFREYLHRSKIARLADSHSSTHISLTALYELILTNLSVADALDFRVSQKSELLSFLSERSPLKDTFRYWSSRIDDSFIEKILKQLEELAENFNHTVRQLRRRLDALRRRYENELQLVDSLEIVRAGKNMQIRAGNDWSNLVAKYPEGVNEVYGIFRTLENQRKEMQQVRTYLNSEVRGFIVTLIPLFLAKIEQQPRWVWRSALGNMRPSIKLAEKMIREAKQTDFLLGNEGLKVPFPKIPKQFAAIKNLSGYKTFKRVSTLDQIRNAETVEYSFNQQK